MWLSYAEQKFSIDWANGEADGSKIRHWYGYKPDAAFLRNGMQIGFMEVKTPGRNRSVREYLQDYWNLANFCKDAIEGRLQNGVRITEVATIQIFSKWFS
ncbi:hypothetical protein BG004_005337 [Podila humilis]|nr:hypothetical protein BG004_005337 [Podila humilis]